jgi:glutamate racemase
MACIGVFDSGVGGLTVLAALRRALPRVPLHYVADSAHAPYGERSPEFIRERSLALAQRLIGQGATLIVVACNTATAHAADALRAAHPTVPIVGIEPGIKPAVARSSGGRIGVLATTSTVNSARFQALLSRHAEGREVTAVAAAGVVSHIERGDLDSQALRQLVAQHVAPLKAAQADTVLLGCTHYPLIRPLWAEALGPDVHVVEVEDAVAMQAQRLWNAQPAHIDNGRIWLQSTGGLENLGGLARRALGWESFALSMAGAA